LTPHPPPPYARTGLDRWTSAVPLRLALPPGDPSSWTCLYTLLGPEACIATQGHRELVSLDGLRALLHAAGRDDDGVRARAALLTVPIPRTDPDPVAQLAALVKRAVRTEEGAGILDLLQVRPDLGERLESDLLRLAEAPMPRALRRAAIRGLGTLVVERGSARWTRIATVLARWDGALDGERLLAMVRLGAMPDELPMGELAPLHGWIPGMDAAAGRRLLEELDGLDEPLAEIVRAALAMVPGAAAALAELVVARVAEVPDEGQWLPVFTAAGEDVVDLLLEQLEDSAGSEDWKARMGGVMALGALSELPERGIRVLRDALLDDDSDVRREASLALRRHGQPVAIDSWTDHYDFGRRVGPHHPWGAAFVGGPVALDLVALLVRREGGGLLTAACLALAFHHPEMSARALDELAMDRGFDVPMAVRVGAAAAVMTTGTVPRDPVLHALLLGGEHQHVRATIPVEDASGTPEALATVAARDGDWLVRHRALELIGRHGLAERYGSLLDVLVASDPDSDVRALAARLRAPGFRPVDAGQRLARLVSATRVDSGTRVEALEALAEEGAPFVEGLAEALYRTEDRAVCVLAGRILGAGAAPEQAMDRVAMATIDLRHPGWIRREAAAALLGSLDRASLPSETVEELVETLLAASSSDPDMDVRRMARWAADTLGEGGT
jgi:HEAT repeat protein